MTHQRARTTPATVAAGFALLLASTATMAQDAPRIVAGPYGQAEALFRNGCVVTFDARGAEVRYLPACSRDQRIRARGAIDDWRQDQDDGDGGRGRAPDLSVQRDGSIVASFRNACDVRYDRFGRRIAADRSCGEGHLRRADAAVERYRQEHGVGGGDGVPTLRAEPDRSIVASFRNGCDVRYDRHGRRVAADRSCSASQLRRADDVVERYRREQGWGTGGSDGRGPQVTLERNGSGSVEFRDGCTVSYNRQGERRDADRRCSSEQKQRADRLMAEHRREQGFGGGGSSGGQNGITVGRDGHTEVRMGRSCTVRYTKDGVRLAVDPGCSPSELKKADEMEVKFRLHRIGDQQRGEGN